MKIPCVVVGGGLSGLAAAIRLARFIPDVVLLEQHSRLGGLNSYYYRNKTLFETGLHAITNYAPAGDKRAPLNRLFRQLKLNRKQFSFLEQKTSEVVFTDRESLSFSNDFSLFKKEVETKFPASFPHFCKLLEWLKTYDPFVPAPFTSTRAFLNDLLQDQLLTDMILCPLMYYGSAVEEDMDLSQFAIMFKSIFLEGMFRPEGTIKDFLHTLRNHFLELGGTIRLGAKVLRFHCHGKTVSAIELESGEIIETDMVLSTIGLSETLSLLYTVPTPAPDERRLGFIESIYQLPVSELPGLPDNKTVIFYSNSDKFQFKDPGELADLNSGVICFPYNFDTLVPEKYVEFRTTHLASYKHWRDISSEKKRYLEAKEIIRSRSREAAEKIVGKLSANIVYEDTFTPLTIERYTAKKNGAIYGSPKKLKDGDIGYDNIFLAGTDQGFLGIIGSMLSGVSIVNQHLLSRF